MEKSGAAVGVCVSQRRTDPKKNVGEGLLQKRLGLVEDAHAGTEREVSLLAIESIQKLCQQEDLSAGLGLSLRISQPKELSWFPSRLGQPYRLAGQDSR